MSPSLSWTRQAAAMQRCCWPRFFVCGQGGNWKHRSWFCLARSLGFRKTTIAQLVVNVTGFGWQLNLRMSQRFKVVLKFSDTQRHSDGPYRLYTHVVLCVFLVRSVAGL